MSALAVNRHSQSLASLQYFQKKDYKRMKVEEYKKMKNEKDMKKCEYCGTKGHIKAECFQIVVYLE